MNRSVLAALDWPRIIRHTVRMFLLFFLVFWLLDCWPEWKQMIAGEAPPAEAWLRKLWRPDRLFWLSILAFVLQFRDAYRDEKRRRMSEHKR